MTFFPSLGDDAGVPHALAKFNTGTGKPLLEFHDALLRTEDSPLTIGQREMIAAYVSGTNSCKYCHGSHTRAAVYFGIDEGLISSLLDDVDTAGIEDEMKPIMRFVRKLTLEPSKMTQADADAVFDAGWNERALYDAIQVCALYNFMNRYVEGIGIEWPKEPRPAMKPGEGPSSMLYTGLMERFDIK
jgi:uncharacterized peroxidase-related enzyme